MKKMSLSKRFLRLQFSGLSGVLGANSRIDMYDTIELLLSNQVQLAKAIKDLHRVESRDGKKKNDVKAVVLQDCMIALANGQNLSTALRPWIPDEEFQLLAAGERSGLLIESLKDVTRLIEAKRTIVQAVAGGAIYPIVLMFMITILLHQIANEMVPKFAKILPPDQWTGASVALRVISDLVVNYGVYLAVGFFVVMAWVFWSMPNMDKSKLRLYLDKIPPWSIYRMLHGSTFLLNTAVMLKAEIRVQDILIMMSKSGSPWLKRRIRLTLRGIERGLNLGEALYRTGLHFPDERAVQFLRLLAEQDGFDEKLVNFGERWLAQSVSNVKAASSTMLAVGVLIAGGLIGLILAGVVSIQALAQQVNVG